MAQEILHYPSLKTILMVEEAIDDADFAMTKEELKRQLPKKIMHQTLNVVLDYLEQSRKIWIHKGKIVWVHNPSPKLQKAIDEGVEVTPEYLRELQRRIHKQ